MEKIRTMLSHLRVCITKVFQKQYYKGNGNSVLKNIHGAKIMLTNGAIIYYKSFVARKVTGENYATTDAWLLLF